MGRKKLPKKRVSMYRLVDNSGSISVNKYEVVRGEHIVAVDGGYEITRIGDNSLHCNCPARISPCRHIKMHLYAKAMGVNALSTDCLIYWEADEKEPEVMSLDDVRDIWDIPEGEDGSSDYD